MKLSDFCSTPERLGAMHEAMEADESFPDWTALGSLSGPEVHQLMIHFNRDDELNCILLNPDEVEFIGDMHNKVLDNPRYRPGDEELLRVKCMNLKLAMCGSK